MAISRSAWDINLSGSKLRLTQEYCRRSWGKLRNTIHVEHGVDIEGGKAELGVGTQLSRQYGIREEKKDEAVNQGRARK